MQALTASKAHRAFECHVGLISEPSPLSLDRTLTLAPLYPPKTAAAGPVGIHVPLQQIR